MTSTRTLHRPLARFWLLAAVLVSLASSLSAAPPRFETRQYYSSWRFHQKGGYHFRTYFFKPSPQFVGFRHHYVIFHPKRPNHLFFFNPYKKQFWGRCPLSTGGKPQYSLLAEKDRKEKLDEIREESFPEPGELPPIPESSDGLAMDLPPDDLPSDDALPGN
jgi:hypothetical protein